MAKAIDKSSFDLIRTKLFDEEEGHLVQLNHKQQEMMDRWNFVIEMRTCEQLQTKDIVLKLMENYGVERATAFNDIGNAEALFGYSTPLNKRYRIGARINYLEEKIAMMYEKEEFKAAAMLESSLQKYYNDYPELKAPTRPTKFTFQFNGDKVEDLPTVEDAIAVLEEDNNG